MAQDPLRIGFVSPFWPPGHGYPNGIVTAVAHQVDAVRRQGHRALVLSSNLGPHDGDAAAIGGPKLLTRDWFKAHFERHLEDQRSPRDTTARRTAAAVAKAGGLDLLEMEESFGTFGLVAQRLDIPVAVRLHGPYFIGLDHRGRPPTRQEEARVRAEREAFRGTSAASAPSQATLDAMIAHADYRPAVTARIPNPVAIPQRSVDWEGGAAKRLLFVGKMTRPKGADVVCDALPEILKQNPGAEVTLAGPDDGFERPDGSRRTVAELLEERLPPEDLRRVHLPGKQTPEEIDDLRRRHGVTIVASRYENFPYAAVEAMAAGSALVASRWGGEAELVGDGETGILVDPGDAGQLVRAVTDLMLDAGRQRRIGDAARAFVARELDLDAVGRQLDAFYREVAAAHHSVR